MPKKVRDFSAIEIKNLIKPGRYAVGNIPGLMLFVKDTGTRSWVYRTRYGGKRLNIGLGGYPQISLKLAKEKAIDAKILIDKGINPIEQKRSIKAAVIASQNGHITFKEAAIICHDKKSPEFRNKKHSKQWFRSLELYALPIIGNMPVSDIGLNEVLTVLEPIWRDKTETATRLRQRIEDILNWAKVSKFREGDNPAKWQGNLDAILPKPGKIKKVKHHRALPYKEIYSFIHRLREREETMTAKCLEFLIMTASRSQEVRLAEWTEIDFQEKVWKVPAEHMKAGRPHKVPLSDEMLNLLFNLPRFQDSPYLFPAPQGGAFSDMALSMLCRRMKVAGTPHGFRSTFRDWAAEQTNYPRDVCEMALAHSLGSKTEEAYLRSDLFDKRRLLMNDWNLYINTKPTESAKIIRLREANNE